MKKLLFFMCLIMNFACIILAALLCAIRAKGQAAYFLGQSVAPTLVIIALMALSVVFVIMAIKLAVTMRKK